MPLPIRSRLLVLVLSVMLPGIIAALWVSWRTWSDEQEATLRHMRDSTRALSMVVDKELARRAGIARVLSLSQILDSAPQVPQDDLAMLELQSRRAMQGLSGWVELNAPGRTLFSTRLASGRVPDTPLAPAAAASAPGLAVTGPAAVAAAPAPLELPTTAASRPVLVREAVPLIEQAVIGDLGPDPATGQLRAQIVQPIERGGHVWLNMSISVLPQEMQQIIDAQRLPPDWTATIMDGRGTVVARHPGGISYAGRPGTDDLRRLMATREEARFDSVNLDGKPVVGYFTKSPQGWTVVTAVPRDSGMGGLGGRTALQPIAIGALLLVLVGMFGALWISRRISGPIHALSAIASELRAGEPVRAPKTGMLECDEVALALADASVAIRQGRSELEDRVNEAIDRTREAEQLSSRSQRTAALGRLTGGVAHDFNNLLGVISNSAHLIQRSPHAESLAMPLGAIMRSVDVGSRLTQHLLRVAGRQPVHPQVVDLRSTLGEMNELLATVLGKRMQLTMTMAPDLPSVRVDPSELELALINIALNARDATNGMGEITLEAGRAAPGDVQDLAPGEYVAISVSDRGPGIPEDLLVRVFEPFFTTKPVGKGTGLGLSQVLGFCVQAGGTARIASQLGAGTTVTLLLPARSSASAGGGARDEVAQPETRANALAGARVLLVEDNEELNRVTASLLRSFSCQVLTAKDADEALQLFGSGAAVDVVLSDVVMPGSMDGQALARELRKRRPGLPVVLISGYSEALTAESSFIVLRKPASPSQILEALRRAMGLPTGM
ncbi:Signal transduction histidine kinase [Mitsuaria sp. PDC51]|uniref:ATP-binding protein n=1 Tax=Mitsuaria sp. PDC51 TaxID=1881035 RepID=UPI0008E936D0|nr:ATP-binding protein [Mitsuaria sp. PDC51]SFR81184.1 Signal transduction histidine kinase [Mitsuaria sp. PDC51]